MEGSRVLCPYHHDAGMVPLRHPAECESPVVYVAENGREHLSADLCGGEGHRDAVYADKDAGVGYDGQVLLFKLYLLPAYCRVLVYEIALGTEVLILGVLR